MKPTVQAALKTAIKATLAILSIAPLAAQAPKANLPESLRLYVLDCGLLHSRNPAARPDMVVACYLIAHPKGTLMWDAGVIPDEMFTPGVTTPRVGSASADKPLREQLRAAGYDPKDITYFALSHYHFDHVANSNMFAGSTWLVRKAERDKMVNGTSDSRNNALDHISLLKNSKYRIVESEEYDVFGDGSVVLKSTPGHTPGHQVLFVNLKKSQPVVLAGDLYHFRDEIGSPTAPASDEDGAQTLKSRQQLDEFLKQHKAEMWIEHELAVFEKQRKAPQFYE